MGKVKDEISGPKPTKPPKGKTGSGVTGGIALFLANLATPKLYKPMQGWYARLYTAIGLGLIAAGGVWQVYDAYRDSTIGVRLGLPAILLAIGAWATFRIVHFPPFAEFLIATEAEMNKVSWTTKESLYRSTLVVLSTVLVLALYLFVIDSFWLFLLRMVGVLQFSGGGSFGSTS